MARIHMNCHKTLGPFIYGLRNTLIVDDIHLPAPVVWEIWENYSKNIEGP